MDKTQIDERLAQLRARAADVLGEPPDTSDAGGLSQVERAIQVGEAAAFRGTLITEWSTKAERVRQWFVSLADDVSNDALGDVLNAHAVACDIRALAAEIPSESETTTAARLREAKNAEAARQVARCAAELGYVGEPATLAVAVGDACLAFARELREIHARHAVTVKRLEAELARAVVFAEAREKISRLPVVLVGGDPVLLAPGAEFAGWTAEDGGPLSLGALLRFGDLEVHVNDTSVKSLAAQIRGDVAAGGRP